MSIYEILNLAQIRKIIIMHIINLRQSLLLSAIEIHSPWGLQDGLLSLRKNRPLESPYDRYIEAGLKRPAKSWLDVKLSQHTNSHDVIDEEARKRINFSLSELMHVHPIISFNTNDGFLIPILKTTFCYIYMTLEHTDLLVLERSSVLTANIFSLLTANWQYVM